MPDNARAALIADAQAMDDVLGALDATRGPVELALYEANSQATRYLVEDLPRLDARGRVLVLLAPRCKTTQDSTTKKTNFTSFCIRLDQIDYFDSGE